MSYVSWSKLFSCEHMAQVPLAIGTLNLRPYAVWIRQMLYGTLNFLVEGWPSAMGFKLVF